MKTKHMFFLVMISLFSLPIFAQNMGLGNPGVIDNAGLLSPAQITFLEERIASIAKTYNFDLVILTERNIGRSDPGEYADNFFDNNGYGLGPDRDGSLFLQVVESRDYWFSPSGRGLKILNDTAYDKLDKETLKYLREGKPFEAYNAFLLCWEEFLVLDAKGRNYNFFHEWNAILIIAAWVLALLIGIYVILVWKSKMNTALAQAFAGAYTVPDSLVFKEKKDRFLYSTVTKTRRKTESSSSGGSSGRSSRGRGGKY